jgi:hypothetical protein
MDRYATGYVDLVLVIAPQSGPRRAERAKRY